MFESETDKKEGKDFKKKEIPTGTHCNLCRLRGHGPTPGLSQTKACRFKYQLYHTGGLTERMVGIHVCFYSVAVDHFTTHGFALSD